MSIIVYGPQGCGKTKNSVLISDYFKTKSIVEEATWPMSSRAWEKFKEGDELWLVSCEELPPYISRRLKEGDRRIISFEDVMADINSKKVSAGTGTKVVPFGSIDGYGLLANVLSMAYTQASVGKGHERHSMGEAFEDQVILEGARRFGRGALLFQAFKKSEESQRLTPDKAIAELLGAINYLAAAVIHIEETRGDE